MMKMATAFPLVEPFSRKREKDVCGGIFSVHGRGCCSATNGNLSQCNSDDDRTGSRRLSAAKTKNCFVFLGSGKFIKRITRWNFKKKKRKSERMARNCSELNVKATPVIEES